jgi:uncharacterized protein YcbK (DUF882 family)
LEVRINMSARRRLGALGAVAILLSLSAVIGAVSAAPASGATAASMVISRSDSQPTADSATADEIRFIDDSLRGRSGKLLMRLVTRARATLALPLFARLFGDSAVEKPGIYSLPDSIRAHPFTFVALRPFTDKQRGRVGSYRLGFWPSERRGRITTDAYENPDGFIEVTPENQDMQISEHFKLSDFLTHDQKDVWPKYLVLNEDLVDKLELVIAQLQRDGVQVGRMVVMSGFRTPWYNRHGGQVGGRAELSRHMYGDAADVFIDNTGRGRMSDLNHDGRVDSRDARVILRAVEEVEREHPELAGGVGVYRATRRHGPFAHIDVRGWRARWGRS